MKKHCDLCDNQILNIDVGLVCSVTKMKPNFINLCSKIKFKNTLETKLESVLIEHEYLKYTRKKLFVNNYVKLLLGIFILCCGIFSLKLIFSDAIGVSLMAIKYLILVPGLLLTTGLYFIKFSITKILALRKELLRSTEAKENIDNVLKLYHKKYSYHIKFDREIHGIQNVNVAIKFL